MADRSRIEWTDATWNPIRGCTRVSEGCRHCYAERIAGRFSGRGMPYEGLATRHPTDGGRWTGDVRVIEDHLEDPFRWRKPRRVFVNSMSDLFHEKLTDAEIAVIFAVMARAQHHTFQILTKRPARMRQFVDRVGFCDGGWLTHDRTWPRIAYEGTGVVIPGTTWPLPNVWLGVSCENQAAAEERIPLLLQTPAEVRFVSAEPLLGPIDFECYEETGCPTGWLEANGLDWVIVGGESGPGARPMAPDWVTSIRDQCVAEAVPFFFKQWGGPTSKTNGRQLYGRTWDGFPK